MQHGTQQFPGWRRKATAHSQREGGGGGAEGGEGEGGEEEEEEEEEDEDEDEGGGTVRHGVKLAGDDLRSGGETASRQCAHTIAR